MAQLLAPSDRLPLKMRYHTRRSLRLSLSDQVASTFRKCLCLVHELVRRLIYRNLIAYASITEPAPVPTVYAAGPRSAFSNSTQEHEARQSLQRMNHEARSSFGVQAVQEISKLLHPQRLSKL